MDWHSILTPFSAIFQFFGGAALVTGVVAFDRSMKDARLAKVKALDESHKSTILNGINVSNANAGAGGRYRLLAGFSNGIPEQLLATERLIEFENEVGSLAHLGSRCTEVLISDTVAYWRQSIVDSEEHSKHIVKRIRNSIVNKTIQIYSEAHRLRADRDFEVALCNVVAHAYSRNIQQNLNPLQDTFDIDLQDVTFQESSNGFEVADSLLQFMKDNSGKYPLFTQLPVDLLPGCINAALKSNEIMRDYANVVRVLTPATVNYFTYKARHQLPRPSLTGQGNSPRLLTALLMSSFHPQGGTTQALQTVSANMQQRLLTLEQENTGAAGDSVNLTLAAAD